MKASGVAVVWALGLSFLGGSIACASDDKPELRTVPYVDLARYEGKWFEIARFPNRFQKGCTRATAEYQSRDDGKINVINTCEDLKTGELEVARGLAQVADPLTFAKLKVSFLPKWLRWLPFGKGNYWVVDLDADYQWVAVSEPKREYLWILSRKPELSRETYERILERLEEQGLDVTKLVSGREK